MLGFYLFIMIVIAQRIVEIRIAKRNTEWVKKNGGYEVGADHYKYIVIVHALFFISIIIEVTRTNPTLVSWSLIPFMIFILAQIGRFWALSSLGRFWNTRIMIIPGAKVVAKGPYRFMRHPNYVIVATEIMMLPLIFQAYWTAVIFSLLNALVLSVRIKVEEKALQGVTNYQDVFKSVKRFTPS